MDIFISNLVNSSFEHVLHLYGFHIVSTYTYEVSNCIFDFISYLLDQLSSFEVSQNSMTHLNQCLLLNIKKAQQCCVQKSITLNEHFPSSRFIKR
jgi:hypothetical protein